VVGTVRRTWIVVFAFFALAGSAHAASDTRLLTKFQPVTRFDSAESFRPTTVESFIADSDLEPVGPGVGLNQRYCTPSAALGDLSCYVAHWTAHDAPEVVYGRVARLETRIVVQYWYFYYDDVYSYPFAPPGAMWQAHEGDWEVVNVVLSSDEQPVFVGYSQHCLGQRRAWSQTQRFGDTHPVVFVALGSHANYFAAGLHQFNLACVPPQVLALLGSFHLPPPADVVSGGGVSTGPNAAEGAVTTIHRLDEDHPAWLSFPGTWGEDQYFHAPAPIGTVPLGTSPQGPAFHEVWTSPLATLAAWPEG